MGGIVGAGLAMGWDQEEMDARIRKAFVESSPVDDLTFPRIAMTRGRKVDRRLEEHYGEACIEDLWRPFYCVSSNITAGGYVVHRTGSLRRALRASISLPGVLPPVLENTSCPGPSITLMAPVFAKGSLTIRRFRRSRLMRACSVALRPPIPCSMGRLAVASQSPVSAIWVIAAAERDALSTSAVPASVLSTSRGDGINCLSRLK